MRGMQFTVLCCMITKGRGSKRKISWSSYVAGFSKIFLRTLIKIAQVYSKMVVNNHFLEQSVTDLSQVPFNLL